MKHFDQAKKMWEELVPSDGQAKTVQGELVRAVEKLRDEAQRNGNINWDEGFQFLSSFLLKTLNDSSVFTNTDLEELQADIIRVQNHKEPYTEDDLYDRLLDKVVEWSNVQKDLIPHEANPKLHR